MHKKEVLPRLALSCLLLLLFVPFASANFVCGEVLNAPDLDASWLEVDVFYTESPTEQTHCTVSPSNNRFCCDPHDIETVGWDIGSSVSARIIDSTSGYFSEPTSLSISGEGYDIFPPLTLKPAITVTQPSETLFVGETELITNISSDSYFDNGLSYELYLADALVATESICSDCNSAFLSIPLNDFGTYELIITAYSSNDESIDYTFSFSNVESFVFNRAFTCDGCEEDFVPPNAIVNMTLSYESSHLLEGAFSDYFPTSWIYIDDTLDSDADLNGDELVNTQDLLILLASWGDCSNACPADFNSDFIVDGHDLAFLLSQWSSEHPPEEAGGYTEEELSALLSSSQSPDVIPYSDTHNQIRWSVSDTRSQKSYRLLSPSDFFPRSYVFFSSFNTLFGNELDLYSYRFFRTRLFAVPTARSDEQFSSLSIARSASTSPARPLFINLPHKQLTEIAIFPTISIRETTSLFIREQQPITPLARNTFYFSIETDIKSPLIDTALIRFKHSKKSKKDINLYYFDDQVDSWARLEKTAYDEDDSFIYYEVQSEQLGFFGLHTEKRGVS